MITEGKPNSPERWAWIEHEQRKTKIQNALKWVAEEESNSSALLNRHRDEVAQQRRHLDNAREALRLNLAAVEEESIERARVQQAELYVIECPSGQHSTPLDLVEVSQTLAFLARCCGQEHTITPAEEYDLTGARATV